MKAADRCDRDQSEQLPQRWYYLGRAQLQLGDLRGADSSFTRLEKLSPECAEEVKGLRQKAWVVLVGPSTEFMRTGQLDSSIAILREANIIARYYPQGYYNLAGSFANMKPQPMVDSAIFYFKIAQEKAALGSAVREHLQERHLQHGVPVPVGRRQRRTRSSSTASTWRSTRPTRTSSGRWHRHSGSPETRPRRPSSKDS